MSDEQGAAYRLLGHWYDSYRCTEEGLSRECLEDIYDVCKAVVGEADDAELMTPQWLLSVGAAQIDSIARHWVIGVVGDRFMVMWFPNDDTLRLHANNLDCDGKTSLGGCHVVMRQPTRGHVRRLLAALGAPTTPTTPTPRG